MPCLHRKLSPYEFCSGANCRSSVSLGGFWTNGLSAEGGIRVGDDDEGA